jgi:hypothetical protein
MYIKKFFHDKKQDKDDKELNLIFDEMSSLTFPNSNISPEEVGHCIHLLTKVIDPTKVADMYFSGEMCVCVCGGVIVIYVCILSTFLVGHYIFVLEN